MKQVLSTIKVIEIFRSIQGEGPYLGIAQVFVRLFECNMHCVWCDSPASIGDTSRKFSEMDNEELVNKVKEIYKGCHSVSITGGEPLMQVDALKDLLPRLKAMGAKIYLETNGTMPDELARVINLVDIVSMDLKLPTSTRQQAFWKEHKAFLKIAAAKEVFLKAVITRDTQEEDIHEAMAVIKSVDEGLLLVLQPNYFDMSPTRGCVEKCIELQKLCLRSIKDVRIIPQVHKFMKLR